jgi:C-terminal processing protease CtpA/Prc
VEGLRGQSSGIGMAIDIVGILATSSMWTPYLLVFFLITASLFGQGVQNSPPVLDRRTISEILGFEGGDGTGLPNGWHGGPPGTIEMDKTIVHSGVWSVRLQRKQDSSGAFSSITAHIPRDFSGSQIQLRGFLRTDDVEQMAGLWLREDSAGATIALRNMAEQSLRGTNEWKEYTISLPIYPAAESISFGVLLAGAGTAWADDLQLVVDGHSIADAPEAPKEPSTNLDRDHEFDHGSQIHLTQLTPIQIDNLAVLGQVWGFLKYHHPTITAGRRHWDYDLLRILPGILQSQSRSEANALMVHWTDDLGEIPLCNPCAQLSHTDLALAPDLDWIGDASLLGKQLSDRLQRIYANRPTSEQFYVGVTSQIENPVFEHELAYANLAFPDSGFQLLSLFRFWNILQYWYPYREVAGQHWPQVLREFIPRVALAKNKDDYQFVMMAFTAEVNDSHADWSSSIAVRPPVGECRLPVKIRFIGGEAIVAGYSSSTLGPASSLKVGDELDRLEDIPVSELVKNWSPFYSASNEAARLRDISRSLTNGACGQVRIDVKRSEKPLRLTATRVPAGQLNVLAGTHDLPGPTFRLLSKDIAYLKLSSVRAEDVTHYIELATGTKGLIVDIRNYPSAFVAYRLGNHLVGRQTSFAQFTFAQHSNPGAFQWGHSAVALSPAQPHYTGYIVVLVDEVSQSQAEFTAMAIQAAPNAIVVGSQTAGADGNVSAIPLPGGLGTHISGIGVFYPDKQPTQRIGVHVDVYVEPTIVGIREGRDEVLEAGIKQILGKSTTEHEIKQLAHR